VGNELTDVALERGTQSDDVLLIDELAAILKITRKQIERLERRGAFPIPRLTKLDRHPRYSRVVVDRFVSGKTLPLLSRRRA
jgi:MerR HTH family regulatory protein